MKRRSIFRRIAGAFLAMAFLTGAFGGLIAILFAYTTEDYIFNRLAAEEVEYLQAQSSAAGLPAPALPFARYYPADTLPDFIRVPLEAEPNRREVFAEDGRHFHVRMVRGLAGGQPVWVVLRVDEYLAVRPAFTGIMLTLGVAILVITVLAALLGLLLAYRVTRPLRALAEEVSALRPDDLPRHWSGRLPDDEVAQLADALLASYQRIAGFVEREQRFTQDVSHELRTPLAVIDSSATLLSKAPDASQAKSLVGRIRSAAMAMHLSVDALLALAREPSASAADKKTALLPVIERCIINHADLLAGKDVDVEVQLDAAWGVSGDPAVLQVLVANLVSNAFRYTQSGRVLIERQGEQLVVSDTGDGIAEALRDSVMLPSVKAPGSPGMGLGLSIVDRLCQRYGWQFKLQSNEQGTIARLTFA
jgi:signal transduction histidine kinase